MRRSDLHLQLEMMRLIGIETLPTNIMYLTRMSWTTFNKQIDFLTKLGYVSKVETEEYDHRTSFVYVLTPEGKTFLTNYFNFAVKYKIMPQIEGDFIEYEVNEHV